MRYMNENFEDFFFEKMKEKCEDGEDVQEYNNVHEDEFAEERSDESYYGRNAGEIAEELEESLDGEDTKWKRKNLKSKYIGDLGELFAYDYLYNLFEKSNIRNFKIAHHNKDRDDYDLDTYVNNRKYVIEVKFSTSETEPFFHHVHFNNDFDFLLLIWYPSDDELYFAVLSKVEAKGVATPENTNRKEDDYKIQRTDIFYEDNQNFLNDLTEKLKLEEELEDLTEKEKLDLLEEAKDQIIKNHPKAESNIFNGQDYQRWVYEYLHNYANDVKLMENRDEYDIDYKGKAIEVKYSSLNYNGWFGFSHIKPELFDFVLFIGLDEDGKKFYFEIKNRDEMIKWLEEHGNNYQENGNEIHVGKSFFKFVKYLDFEDFANYIETH